MLITFTQDDVLLSRRHSLIQSICQYTVDDNLGFRRPLLLEVQEIEEKLGYSQLVAECADVWNRAEDECRREEYESQYGAEN